MEKTLMGKDSLSLFDSFLFPYLFRAFRMSVHPRRLAVAFLGIALLSIVGWLMDSTRSVCAEPSGDTELSVYLQNADSLAGFVQARQSQGIRVGVFSTLYHFAVQQFHEGLRAMFGADLKGLVVVVMGVFKALEWVVIHHTLYSLAYFSVVLPIMAVIGGALCRMAALQSARGERPGLVESLRFGVGKFRPLVGCAVVPLGLICVGGLVIAALGLVGNIPRIGEILVGLSMPLALGAAAATVFLILGILAGADLMWPAIAYEDGDSYTAINCVYRYVFARPWRLGFYKTVSVVYGALTYGFVRLFAFLLLWVCYRFLQLGFLHDNTKLDRLWPGGPSLMAMTAAGSLKEGPWTMILGSHLIQGGAWVVVGMVMAFLVSFYFSVHTIIYGIMRRRVDGVELDCMSAPDAQSPAPAPAGR